MNEGIKEDELENDVLNPMYAAMAQAELTKNTVEFKVGKVAIVFFFLGLLCGEVIRFLA